MESRYEKYFDLSSQLARLTDSQMRALIDGTEATGSSTGWGASQTLAFENSKVFVKRVPVTKLEYDNLFSTANLYQLPTFCNYGLGSTGFGVFRELLTYLKTTHWVLQGETAHFPLLYHYRLLPYAGPWAEVDDEAHREFVASWANNENLSRYALERAKAPYELILCLEHIPYVLESWLRENPQQLRDAFVGSMPRLGFCVAKVSSILMGISATSSRTASRFI